MSDEKALALKPSDPIGAALAAYNPDRFNLCAPVTALDRLPAMHRLSVRVVQVDPATETYKIPGEKDDDPKRKVGLSKVALDKLAAAANIQWVPDKCGRVDDGKDPSYITYRAVGVLRNFDGEQRVICAEKTIDLRGRPGAPDHEMGADTLELIRVAEKKNADELANAAKYKRQPRPPRDPWQQIAQARQQAPSYAESKAKNRAIRQALAVPVAMPLDQVGKPFVIPALVLNPDMTDPQVKAAALQNMYGATAALYGGQAAQPARTAAPTPAPLDVDPETGELLGPEAAGPGPAPAAGPAQADGGGEGDPWEELTGPRHPFPVPLAGVMDPKRASWLQQVNTYAQKVIDSGRPGTAEALEALGAGVDFRTCSFEQLADVGRALAAMAKGVAP